MPITRCQLLTTVLLALPACSDDASRSRMEANLYVVTREDLPITVKENGELQAVRETIVRSEVEGQATIIYLIPEGTAVDQGEKLVELDVSDLVERRATQEINVEKARSALEQARTQQQILEKELMTLYNTAASQLRIAEMELEKLLGARGSKGTEGKNADMLRRLEDLVAPAPAESHQGPEEPPATTTRNIVVHVRPEAYAGLVDRVMDLLRIQGEDNPLDRDMGEMANKILQQTDQIRLAMADLKVKEDTVSHSRRLAAKQFITRNELERDELAFQSQASKVTIAWNDLELLINYELQRDRIKMTQDFENSKLELERVLASNDAERKKSQFDVEAKQKEYQVAKERLDNMTKQIGNAICYAPAPGIVVYARVNRDRRGGEAITEGMQVRERQELIILPDNSQMRCVVKVQEAQIDMVAPGQAAHVSVEAFPTVVLTGRVARVAPVADSSNSWMGNDKKVYTTIIDIDGINNDNRLRSRMAAAATITVDTVRDAVTVPMQAVRRDRSVNYVWKHTPKGPIAVQVQVGAHNQEKVQIIAGVEPGETVYRSPPGGQPDPKFPQPALPTAAPQEPQGAAASVPATARAGNPGGNGRREPPGSAAVAGVAAGRETRGDTAAPAGAPRSPAGRKSFREMTAEELTASKDSLVAMSQRVRPMLDDEQAAKLDKLVADISSAIAEQRLDDAQALRDSMRALMPRRVGTDGGAARGRDDN